MAEWMPKHGRQRRRLTQLVREFAGRFTDRHGSLVCRELLGCDLSTPEGFQLAKEKKLSDTVCTNLVRDAAAMIADIV